MAWQSSDRRSRLPDDWWRRRGHVLKHAGYRCQHIRFDTGVQCTEPAKDVDHIKPGDDHSYGNLQALCAWHHKQKTAQEAAAGRAARGTRSRRRPDDGSHPADLG